MNKSTYTNELIRKTNDGISSMVNDGKLEEAQSLLRDCRLAMPNNWELFSIEAVIALLKENYISAEQALKMGLLVNGNNADLMFNYGFLCEKKGRIEEAISYYQIAKLNGDKELGAQIETIIAKLLPETFEGQGENKLKSTNRPKVSVIIPTYNMKTFLKEAIDSVLLQNYDDIEIVVGDDCSTDDTDEMMRAYKDNPKVHYIRNENNLGSSKNSMKLLYEHAKGEYILGLNHDDYLIQNNYINNAVSILENNSNVSLVFANCRILEQDTGRMYAGSNIALKSITNGKEYFLNYQSSGYPPIPSTLTSIYRRADAIRIGCLLEDVYSQDTFLYLKLMLLGDVAFVNDYVGVYRVHNNSLTHNFPLDKDQSTISEFESLYSLAVMLGLEHDEMIRWLQTRVLSYIMWRLDVMWLTNKQYALELLLSISTRYSPVFDAIASNFHWANQTERISRA